MKILDHLAQAAAVLLLLELLVVLIIFLAISGGLAFGLRWVNGKSEWAFGKANSYLPLVGKYTKMGTGYVKKGADYAALPFIKANGLVGTAKGTVAAIERRIRGMRTSTATTVAARPVRPATEEPTTVEPLSLV